MYKLYQQHLLFLPLNQLVMKFPPIYIKSQFIVKGKKCLGKKKQYELRQYQIQLKEKEEVSYQIFEQQESEPQIQKLDKKQQQSLLSSKRPRRKKSIDQQPLRQRQQQQKQRFKEEKSKPAKQYVHHEGKRQKIKKQIEANQRDLQYKYRLQAHTQPRNQNPLPTNYKSAPKQFYKSIMKYQLNKSISEDINKFHNITVSELSSQKVQYQEELPQTIENLLLSAQLDPKCNSQIVGLSGQELQKYRKDHKGYLESTINSIKYDTFERIVFQYRKPYLMCDRKYNVLMKNGKSIVMTQRCLKTYFPHLLAEYFQSKNKILRKYLQNR